VDAELLKSAYLARVANAHPDQQRGAAGDFLQLKEAYDLLKDPVKRLRWLARDSASPTAAAPPAELFMEVAEATRALQLKGEVVVKATTTLGRASAIARASQAISKAREVLGKVSDSIHAALAEVARLDSLWPDVRHNELLAVAAKLAFARRWRHQLDDALFSLEEKCALKV